MTLREQLHLAGVSRARMAKLAGVHRRTVFRWVADDNPPRLVTVALGLIISGRVTLSEITED